MSKKTKTHIKQSLLDTFIENQTWEPLENFPNDGHRDLVKEHRENWKDTQSKLDDRWHNERCKLLSRWMDDSWQLDTRMTHHKYMQELSKAIEMVKRDDTYLLRDAVLFVYYPRFALQNYVNWYDEDAEDDITELYGTKEQKKVLDLKHKLREAKAKASTSKLKKMLEGIDDKQN